MLRIAAIIQHFELTYETCWKFLKRYLYEVHATEALSARSVFKECYGLGLIPKNVFDELMKVLEVRNLTTHVYDRLFAHEVGEDILKHQKIFAQIIELIKLSK